MPAESGWMIERNGADLTSMSLREAESALTAYWAFRYLVCQVLKQRLWTWIAHET